MLQQLDEIWKMEKWKMEKWKMENGKWKNGKWKNGKFKKYVLEVKISICEFGVHIFQDELNISALATIFDIIRDYYNEHFVESLSTYLFITMNLQYIEWNRIYHIA